jgi:hypothetical protein
MPLPRRARRRPRIEVASTVCDAMEWKFRNGQALQREKSDLPEPPRRVSRYLNQRRDLRNGGQPCEAHIFGLYGIIFQRVDCAHARIA